MSVTDSTQSNSSTIILKQPDVHLFNNLSLNDCISIYNTGNYDIANELFKSFRNNESDNIVIQLYLLAMCDYKTLLDINVGGTTPNVNESNTDPDPNSTPNGITRLSIYGSGSSLHTEIYSRIKNNDPLGKLIYGLYHIGLNPLDNDESFPEQYNGIFGDDKKDIKKGINILEKINTMHSLYILSKIYLSFESFSVQKSKGNNYLLRSAKAGHFKARKELDIVGVNYNDIDQFGDHCNTWICIPDCSNGISINKCIGCGKINDGTGWVGCNCLLCGCKTELDCAGIAAYITDGFINLLKAIEHPIKLCTCLTAIASSGLLSNKSTQDYGLVLGYVVTGLTTLSLFIRQEINPDPNKIS